MTMTTEEALPTLSEEKTAEQPQQKEHVFSEHLSSEENNKSDDMNFYGRFSHIRKTLDYSYHSNYRKERQWLQDTIIEEMLECVEITDINGNTCTTPTEPWLVFTAGAMGAGKSYTINSLVDDGRFPLLAFVLVDPDEIRRQLPEYSYFVEHNPELAGELTRKEAGYMAEILTLAGLQAGKNVMVDGSLRDSDWYQIYFAQLRREYDGIRIAILHIDAPRDAVIQRAKERGEATGRVIPMKTLLMALEQVPRSVKILGPLADYFCKLNNAPGKEIELIKEDEDWDTFQMLWFQTCAWVPGKKKQPFSRRRSVNWSSDTGDKPELDKRLSIFAMKDRRQRSMRGLTRQKSYSLHSATDQNHKSIDMTFYGPYSHIRKTMDYGYHNNYTKERQWLQDAIVDDTLKSYNGKGTNGAAATLPDPWIVFVAGTMSSGKSHAIDTLNKNGRFPVMPFVRVDYDLIRKQMPEYAIYQRSSASDAEALTRKETGYIAQIIISAALQARKHVVVEASVKAADWYKEYFQNLKDEFSDIRIAILHVTAPIEIAKERLKAKYSGCDHYVPEDVLEEQFEEIPKSVGILADCCDYCCEINNGKNEMELVKEGETWESFQQRW
mmetsp:Transcript_16658/g.22100  ORF Transcript_16658/g.22100 Transcript_16658/m.22100 type:complete len:610 (-) Transcript_16658:158-1987(-)